jgi:hypothetical protein
LCSDESKVLRVVCDLHQALVGDFSHPLRLAGAHDVRDPAHDIRIVRVLTLDLEGAGHLRRVGMRGRSQVERSVLLEMNRAPIRERRDRELRDAPQRRRVIEGRGQRDARLPEHQLPPLISPPRGGVVEDEDDADELAVQTADRRPAVFDDVLAPGPGDERGVVRQTDDAAFSDDAMHGILDGRPRALVDNPETSSMGRPTASVAAQPVNPSATSLRNWMRPSRSVAITASPMLASVVRNHS